MKQENAGDLVMFQGEYTNNMDDKGRINIPAAYREVLQNRYNEQTFIVARDAQSPCLRAYPLQEWKRLLAKLGTRPSGDRVVLAFKRAVVSSAQAYAPDKQGRVLIPQSLRNHAGLQKHTLFAGSADTFEIWDASAWETQLASSLALLQHQDLDF
ncbi:MAG: division/cell wall cluster transcriptional repressor MraZ [Mariprofundaceae bacterium]|nr:division/cell wall cluster transcriptional repressor MraZ [Mariprofundaceae bacterium]